MYGWDVNVTEVPEIEKFEVRQHRDWLHRRHGKEMEILKEAMGFLEKMEVFSTSKKNMFLSIRQGIAEAYSDFAGK